MKKSLKIWTALLIIMFVITGCGTSNDKHVSKSKGSTSSTEQKEGDKKVSNAVYPQLTKEVSEKERLIEMETSMGNIKIKLFPEYAPKAVENFVKHSEKGYYDGLIFHRVIKDFMIQGGDPNGNGTGGESIYGAPFEDEFSNNLFNLRGALSMANSGQNTNGSQFFIVQKSDLDPSMKEQMEKIEYPKEIIAAYEKNGGTPWLDHRHTVFGQVIEGMDIVDKIADTPVDRKDKPKKDVVIKRINVLK
ncbi:peptidylprolyl isomerase [Bacillus salipaludis]|uniref:peptidylprolyl isomerase n=1 Tax=Bacillus salipaludis TaxID=2547811 RepID=UPI002E1DD464|nr:peptidylprolyl isomerase [Bacillus salipaludis]